MIWIDRPGGYPVPGDDEYQMQDPAILPLRSGVDFSLEDDADRLLARDRRELRAMHMRGGDLPVILTTDQLALRRAREVIGPYGAPDRATSSGMYKRVYNPLAGQRPTKLGTGEE
jgi:hypothetical protein